MIPLKKREGIADDEQSKVCVMCIKLLTSLRQDFGAEVWKRRRGRESENAMGYSLDVVMRTRSV